MDADRHELHARFYLGGNCFAADLSRFWSVDPQLAEQVPSTMLDELARFQMGEKVVMDFPDAWRQNVVEVKREVQVWDKRTRHDPWEAEHLHIPEWLRAEQALREIAMGADLSEQEALFSELQAITKNPFLNQVVAACVKHQVLPETLLDEVQTCEAGF